MQIPNYILADIHVVCDAMNGHITHCGIFGSALDKGFADAKDIDVLFVYDGMTFSDILKTISGLDLTYVVAPSYLNYSVGMAPTPDASKYYHFIFMPMKKPNRDFMHRHEGHILYLTTPFRSWNRNSISGAEVSQSTVIEEA